MATSICRALVPLHRVSSCALKGAEVLLESRCSLPMVVQIRTKKRYFVPPSAQSKSMTQEEQEAKARAAGIVPRQQYIERAINISCTAGVVDPYIPPEGDARHSTLSKEGIKQRTEQLKQSAASQLAIRKIKDYDADFTTKDFAVRSQEIFIEAHDALTNFNKVKLHSLVTERCYPEMVRGNRYKTLRWRFIESLEPPKVVHARCPDMVSKGNLYAQVTVRMHTKQTLAVYDRFGRLMMGDEEEPRDVLEYLVIERHLVNPYGRWRLHGKIVPAWAPPKDPVIKTVMIPGPKLKPEQDFEDLNYEVPKPKAVQWHK
ncbi:39S ribosomal protein L45, mitochondrial [Clupea harengus]|uniref:Large ribosomal subunit protein mL45 n=1 Tax=Clupea harengus TaxID=7950 RepID=A0A6P3W3X4_CLUHA|nr:39S ribosomal protein L45, mitochondrial [Clupea harengus]